LDLLAAGKLQPQVQDDTLANYAHKLTKAEAQIDWTQSAAVIDLTIRAFDAYPVAFTVYDGQPLRLFASRSLSEVEGNAVPGTVIAESKSGIDIATGDGVVSILSLQLPGGKRLTAEQFLNGRSLLGVQL
jgi:methionyl-tRNA formyltransferase